MTTNETQTPGLRPVAEVIADQNDRFRTTFGADLSVPGRVVTTCGVEAMGGDFQAKAMAKVMTFDDFSEDNNPHGERDFGAFDLSGEKVFWKIDLLDAAYHYGSERPADTSVTRRVLTIMLASEY